MYSEAPTSGRRLRRFFLGELPRPFGRISLDRAAFAVFLAFAIAMYAVGLLVPDIAANALPEETRQQLAERQLWTNIPEGFRPIVGPLIIVNNVRVSIVLSPAASPAARSLCTPLATNGAMLGTLFAVRAGLRSRRRALAFIAGHGVLELSAIFLSAARTAPGLGAPAPASARARCASARRRSGVARDAAGIPSWHRRLIEGFLSPSGASEVGQGRGRI